MTSNLAIFATALLLSGAAAQADVAISSDPTQNMTCSGGVCSPTAADAVLNLTDLANMLATGDTKVTTGSGAVNIDVVAPLSWNSTSRLTLDANTGLNIQAPITVAGSGALTLTYNDGGSNGDLIFSNGGNATFANLSSSLTINGVSYVLAGDVKTLATNISTNPSGFFALANNYDATADGTYKSAPITTALKGTLDGLGHTIANLKLHPPNRGPTGFLQEVDGVVRDLGLTNIVVRSDNAYGGSLVGENTGTVSRCFASGKVNLFSVVGGLVGWNEYGGSILHSYASVQTNGLQAYLGGLVGWSLQSKIIDSFATGDVTGGDLTGGLVGHNEYSSILNSHATGNVRGVAYYGGGLVGTNYGTIQTSYATGDVSGNEGAEIGGLVGDGSGDSTTNSYARGSAKTQKGSGIVGGFQGVATSAYLDSTYSTGLVRGGTKETRGGYAGTANGGPWNNYFDKDTSGIRHKVGSCGEHRCPGIKGLTTEEFLSGLPMGFDSKIWGQSPIINNGYPYLLANPPPK